METAAGVAGIAVLRFQHGGRGLSQIANGTWVLPYNQTTYDIYRHTYNEWLRLMSLIADHPTHL